MQGFNVAQTTLSDIRDGNSYTVRKLADGNCWMVDNLNLAGGTTLTSATSNVSSNYTLPASSTTGFSNNSVAYVYNDTTYGGYYSWNAATAETGKTAVNQNVAYNICPKGFTMPTNSQAVAIDNLYSNDTRVSPLQAVMSGYIDNGTFSRVGMQVAYWTSTATDANGANYSSESSTGSWQRRGGMVVRCVAI